jgi:hypothetical protein
MKTLSARRRKARAIADTFILTPNRRNERVRVKATLEMTDNRCLDVDSFHNAIPSRPVHQTSA